MAVLALPAWDSLPYDRLPAIVGRRAATLARLEAGIAGPRLVLTSARAVMSRVQPPAHWTAALLALAPGDDADTAALGERLRAFGYGDDERVDEPGHIAVRAHILDVFPGDADMPFRVVTADGRIAAIHPVDGGSQRSAA